MHIIPQANSLRWRGWTFVKYLLHTHLFMGNILLGFGIALDISAKLTYILQIKNTPGEFRCPYFWMCWYFNQDYLSWNIFQYNLTFNIDLTFYMLQISQYRFKIIVIPSTVSSLLFTFPTYSLLFYFLLWFLQSCVCLFIFLFNIQRNGRENRQKSTIHWFTLQLPAIGRYSKWGARHSVCLPCQWQDWTTRTITFFLFMNRKLPE